MIKFSIKPKNSLQSVANKISKGLENRTISIDYEDIVEERNVEWEEESLSKQGSFVEKKISQTRLLFSITLSTLIFVYIVHVIISIVYINPEKNALPIIISEFSKIVFFSLGIICANFYQKEEKMNEKSRRFRYVKNKPKQ